MKTRILIATAICFALCPVVGSGSGDSAGSGPASDLMRAGFADPQGEARPNTWIHWMDGNVSAEGMRKDIAAIADAGITGVELFSLGQHAPEGPVAYLSPEWEEIFRQSLESANERGIAFSVFNCEGWSSSGGPWITPELSMQTVTWNEMTIQGSQKVDIQLPKPETKRGYYRDIAVLAVPDRPGRGNLIKKLNPSVEASSGKLNLAPLLDDSLQTSVQIRAPGGEPARMELRFEEPVTVRSVLLASQRGKDISKVEFQYSQDGEQWESVLTLDEPHTWGRSVPVASANFEAITAPFFRLVSKSNQPLFLSGLHLSGEYLVPDFARRAGYIRSLTEIPMAESLEDEAGNVVDAGEVLDLTQNVDASGRLRWDAPPGEWTIVRIGHTSTGRQNHPATVGKGLECDKMSREAVQTHFDHVAGRLIKQAGDHAGRTFQGIALDSWEAADQNWTPGMPEAFEQRTGYPLRPWLLTLTGRVVGSIESTDRVLWDYRRVLADLHNDNYFGFLTELTARHGMVLINEPYGDGMFSTMDAVGRSGISATEFWAFRPFKTWEDNRAAIMSAARIYGQKVVAAEAFTSVPLFSAWKEHPASMKRQADEMFCRGVNRMTLHTYAHQPWPDHILPGMTMGRWGIHFNRNTTWWPMARAWIDYLSRCQYLLQAGLHAADIAFFIGEERPDILPPLNLPDGYDFDYMNPEVLLTRAKGREGRIELPDGKQYKLLMLPAQQRMSLPVLEQIAALVEAGAVVAGPKPERTWGYHEHTEHDRKLRDLADRLWGEPGSIRAIGKGSIIHTDEVKIALEKIGLAPAFQIVSGARRPDGRQPSWRIDTQAKDVPFMWIQRQIGDRQVYFVSHQSAKPVTAELLFRDAGPTAECWNPVTGEITALPAMRQTDEGAILEIQFEPGESLFVVFGDRSGASPAPPQPQGEVVLDGPWTVSFDPRWKAPAEIEFPGLISWTEHQDPNIQHYSGTAVYRKTIPMKKLDDRWVLVDESGARLIPPTSQLWLDLGEVNVMARVKVNGRDLGVQWFPPLRIDITSALLEGENQIEIEVVNLWVNRLIGDEHFPDDREWKKDSIGGWSPVKHPDWMEDYFLTGQRPSPNRLTYSNWKFYEKDDPLLPSGLIGPVRLLYEGKGVIP